MRWYEEGLWIGNGAAGQKDTVIAFFEKKKKRSRKQAKKLKDLFLITLSENPNELLEILPADKIDNPFTGYADDLYCLGIGYGREEAISLCQMMIEKVLADTGSVDIKTYFGKRKMNR